MCFATPKIPAPPPPPPPAPAAPQSTAMFLGGASSFIKKAPGGLDMLRIPQKQVASLNMGGNMSPINV